MSDQSSEDFRNGMPFLGGRLWLDFLNTTPAPVGDLIATREGFERWLDAAGLSSHGAQRPSDKTLSEALELRGTLRTLFDAMVSGHPIPQKALAVVNHHLAKSPRVLRLQAEGHQLALVEEGITADDVALTRIAADFARFVPDYQASRLRNCGNEACTLVFYDTSRNGTRRWCSMAVCGNRHKVASFRDRQRPQHEG